MTDQYLSGISAYSKDRRIVESRDKGFILYTLILFEREDEFINVGKKSKVVWSVVSLVLHRTTA